MNGVIPPFLERRRRGRGAKSARRPPFSAVRTPTSLISPEGRWAGGGRGAFEPAGVGFGGVTRSRDRCGSPRRCRGSRPRCRGGHCRARMRGIGPTRAVLHIRSGPVDGGSTESCGSAPVLNAVEILPCAERAPVRMRARPLETDILEKYRNHAENPEPARRSAPVQCAAPRPAREEPHRPGAILRQATTGNPACAPGRVKAAAEGPTGNPAPSELRRRPPRCADPGP